jgi:hypothetical protein
VIYTLGRFDETPTDLIIDPPERRVFAGFTPDAAKNAVARACRPPASRTFTRTISDTATQA